MNDWIPHLLLVGGIATSMLAFVHMAVESAMHRRIVTSTFASACAVMTCVLLVIAIDLIK